MAWRKMSGRPYPEPRGVGELQVGQVPVEEVRLQGRVGEAPVLADDLQRAPQ